MIGILTVSDSCASKSKTDDSGNYLENIAADFLQKHRRTNSVKRRLVADDFDKIESALISMCESDKCSVIITTGGTGIGARDVTPEATNRVLDKTLPAIVNAITERSLKSTPMAMLSRATAGVRGTTMIINFPGSLRAAQTCWEVVERIILHAIDLLEDNKAAIKQTHDEVQMQNKGENPEEDESGNGETSPKACSTLDRKISGAGAFENDIIRLGLRESPYRMIEVSKAVDIVIDACVPTFIQRSGSLPSFSDKVVMFDVQAGRDVPYFPASIKDGYAVRADDDSIERNIKGNIIMGERPPDLECIEAGTCYKISTGGWVPGFPKARGSAFDGQINCNVAVIQIEDTEIVEKDEFGNEKVIRITKNVTRKPGSDIRVPGSDIRCLQTIAQAGDVVTPFAVGCMAGSLARSQPIKYKLPHIALLSTGDELVDSNPEPHQVVDSNRPMLSSLFGSQFGFEIKDFGICGDRFSHLYSKLKRIIEDDDVNVLITTGSQSMGEKDMLKEILIAKFDAKVHFARLNMKPGKPTSFLTVEQSGRQLFIFGLPGNPVSAAVTSLILVVPALRKLSGLPREKCRNSTIYVQTDEDIRLDSRLEYRRVFLAPCQKLRYNTETGMVVPDSALPVASSTGNQISSRLLSLLKFNALIEIPSESEFGESETWRGERSRSICARTLSKGAIVKAMLFPDQLGCFITAP